MTGFRTQYPAVSVVVAENFNPHQIEVTATFKLTDSTFKVSKLHRGSIRPVTYFSHPVNSFLVFQVTSGFGLLEFCRKDLDLGGAVGVLTFISARSPTKNISYYLGF